MKTMSKTRLMVTTALSAYVLPKLAKDSKLDVIPYFKGLTAKTYAKDIKGMVTKLCTDAAGMLAPPAGAAAGAAPASPAAAGMGPDDVIHMLASHIIGGEAPSPEAMETDEVPMGQPGEVEAVDEPGDNNAALMEFLTQCGLKPDMLAKVKEMLGGGGEAPAPAPADEDKDDDKDKDKTEDDEPAMTEEAMDKKIKLATDKVRADMTATAEAREFVRPWVGTVAMSFDSAPKVYRAACASLNIEGADKIEDVNALRLLIQSKPQAGVKTANDKQPVLAVDENTEAELRKRFPGAANIGIG